MDEKVRMHALYLDALRTREEFLLKQLYEYVCEGGFSRYASSREEWRWVLRGPIDALIDHLEVHDSPETIHVDENIAANPTAIFGMMEAKRQLRRGFGFDRYFSLSKYVRQSFVDLIYEISPSTHAERKALAMTHRFFDKVELGFTTEWLRSVETALVSDAAVASPDKEDSMHATVELKQQINEVTGSLQPVKPWPVTVETRFLTDDDRIIADPSQIRQMLENLCNNSMTAMEKEGGILLVVLDQIMIESHSTYLRYGLRGGLHAKINIRDTGRGIAPEILDRIFEPFFTTKDVDEGNGMGLALVQCIVQEHGGFITAESSPGKWTNFTILLPRNRWGSDGGETAQQRNGRRGARGPVHR